MTTAHSFSTPPRDPHDVDSGAWPVLARIPDVSPAARPSPQRPPRLAVPARSAAYRFDSPQSRRSTAASPARPGDDRSEIGQHAAHVPQPPAHHLNQRATRLRGSERRTPRASPILPAWDPFTISGRRLPDSFAPILSFLVLVALFTAAGTSILMLRSSNRPPATGSPAPATHVGQTAAGPTAAGPLGAPASRLVPAPPNEPTAVASPSAPSAKLMPTTDEDATNHNVTGVELTPAATIRSDRDYPSTEYPEPIFPESSELSLPRAHMTDTPLPIAHFSGEIQQAPTRQAKNDDQSSIH